MICCDIDLVEEVWERRDMVACEVGGGGYWLLVTGEGRNERHARHYRMAGKFGGEFKLAVWRIMNAPPN